MQINYIHETKFKYVLRCSSRRIYDSLLEICFFEMMRSHYFFFKFHELLRMFFVFYFVFCTIFWTIFNCFYLLNFFRLFKSIEIFATLFMKYQQFERVYQFNVDFLKLFNFLKYSCVFENFYRCSTFLKLFFFALTRKRSIFEYNEWEVRFIVCEIFVMKIDDDVWARSYFCSIQSLWNNINVVMFCSFY